MIAPRAAGRWARTIGFEWPSSALAGRRWASKGIQEGSKLLHEGKLGKSQLAGGVCYRRRQSIGKVDGPQEAPATVDYDLWCGPAQKLPIMRKHFHYDWHWQWNTGNGDL